MFPSFNLMYRCVLLNFSPASLCFPCRFCVNFNGDVVIYLFIYWLGNFLWTQGLGGIKPVSLVEIKHPTSNAIPRGLDMCDH